MKKWVGIIGVLAVLVSTVSIVMVSTVFADGIRASWILRDRVTIAENFSVAITPIGGSDQNLAQSKEEQYFLNFHLTSTWGASPFAPGVGYSNLGLSFEKEGSVKVEGLALVVMYPDGSQEVFLPDTGSSWTATDGSSGETFQFLKGKAIEPTSGGPLDIRFRGVIQGEGVMRYTFSYDAVDQFGHIVAATEAPSGTITVESRDWLVPTNGELASILGQALPGDAILVAKGWFELPDPPVDPSAGLTVYGGGASATLLIGQLRLAEGSALQDISLFNDRSHERQGQDLTYQDGTALRTMGSTIIKNVVVSGPNSWVVMGSPSRGVEPKNQILVEGSVFIGRSGLSLDVYHEVDLENPVVRNNVFIGQQCGISISIDVVFTDIPIMDEGRLEAFKKYSAVLEATNTFVNVDQPVCGARG